MYEGVDTLILYEELAYQDVLPLAWRPITSYPNLPAQGQMAERNLRLLQACAALEEHGQVDKADENAPYAADIMRLDMKMNLLLDLVGRILISNQPRPAPIAVRFNAHGAMFEIAGLTLKPGDEGLVEIYLKDCLVEPLKLVGRVASVGQDGRVKVKFHHPGEAIANLIEKLAFRRHRRQVADSKKPSESEPARTSATRDSARTPSPRR